MRARFLLRIVKAFASASVASAVLACSSTAGTSTVNVLVIPAVVVRAESAVGSRGCGEAPSQVYRYAVVMVPLGPNGPADSLARGRTFPCFTDAEFAAPETEGAFQLRVYSFNRLTWDARSNEIEAAADLRSYAGADAALLRTPPLAVATCSAEYRFNAETVASCFFDTPR